MGIDIEEVVSEGSASGSSFTFHPLDAGLATLQKPETQDLLRKWNLDANMQAKCFRFDQQFKPEQLDAFLLDFFNDPSVQQHVFVSTGRESWGALGKATSVHHSRLSTSVLRMDFFDRLNSATESSVVHGPSGSINKCFDVQVGEILVSDKLRLMLLDEGSEEWETYSQKERDEFIFHIFKRLSIGGGLNQYEDEIKPYLDLTRALYKDFISVHKNVNGQLQVGSLTFAVGRLGGARLFPRDSSNNFCYVTLDPLARHVKLWYSAYFPMM